MKKLNLGYCCQNLTLTKELNIKINRSIKKSTWNQRGIEYASLLAQRNLEDLIKILKWNHEHGITTFRMSSQLFPWMSEYRFEDMPNYNDIKALATIAGSMAKLSGQRLTFHPGHFNVLASPSDVVVKNSIIDINQHSRIMDLMQLRCTPYNSINIHINGTYGNKATAWQRFAKNFEALDYNARCRLTLENDDKKNQWAVNDLVMYTQGTECTKQIPIVFDFLHHKCHPDGLTEQVALELASLKWHELGIKQLCHYSSSKSIEVPKSMYRAHADYVYEKINTHGLSIDVELEAKAKELALLQYREQFQ